MHDDDYDDHINNTVENLIELADYFITERKAQNIIFINLYNKIYANYSQGCVIDQQDINLMRSLLFSYIFTDINNRTGQITFDQKVNDKNSN